ncbi:MAG: hypothetical protein ABID38_04800 [Candidatus Diapherotrites archaeon]
MVIVARRLFEKLARMRAKKGAKRVSKKDGAVPSIEKARKIWGNTGERGPAIYMKDDQGVYFRFTQGQVEEAEKSGFRVVGDKEFDGDFKKSGGELIMWSANKPKR